MKSKLLRVFFSSYKVGGKFNFAVKYRIRVLFSISDINNASPDAFPLEDDMVEAENEDEEDSVSFPVRASVTIEKVKS